MNNNPALLSLARKVVQQQIRERNPLDVEVIDYLIRDQISVADSGDIIITDDDGKPRVGAGPTYGSMSVAERLDELMKDKPTLFATRQADGSPTGSAVNPFAKGPHFSVTQQMQIWKTDPERAEHLAYEAEHKIK